MKLLELVAGFGVAASVFVAPSVAECATYYVWQGDAVVLTATAQCSAGASERTKIAAGTVMLSVVRPALLGSNGNDSRISFNHDRQSMFGMDLAGGLTIAGAGTYAAWGVTTSALIKADVGGNYSAFALTPVAPTISTPSLTLTGTIDDFMFITGCTITFRAGYTARV